MFCFDFFLKGCQEPAKDVSSVQGLAIKMPAGHIFTLRLHWGGLHFKPNHVVGQNNFLAILMLKAPIPDNQWCIHGKRCNAGVMGK